MLGKAIGWMLLGDGAEVWTFAPDTEPSEDECLRMVEELFRSTRA